VNRTIVILSRCVKVPARVLPLLLLPMLALPSACSRARAEEQPSTERRATSAAAPPQKVMMAASWAEYYTSIAELKAHGDLAVVGTVSTIAPTVQPDRGPAYSMVTLSVERTLWTRASTTATPATVTFKETGGTYDGVTYEIEDDPLYNVGDRVVMFFTEYSPGQYRVTGGPTGRFTVSGSRIVPTVKDGVQVVAGTSESAFVGTVLASSP
jgi:hypothetical protein